MKDKREQIFQATQQLISQHGFHGTSMQMVAKEAGVAAGTIYRYFKDKDDLIRQLHYRMCERAAARIFDGFDETVPLYDQYRCLWLNIQGYLLEEPSRLSSRVQFENSPYFDLSSTLEMERTLFGRSRAMFERGVASGELKALPHPLLISLSIDNVLILCQKHIQGRIVLDEELTELAIQTSWDAIRQSPE